MILENVSEASELLKLNKSKLLNMKNHLETLIRKKYRLELEIKSLKKRISKKVIESEKNFKLSVSAESTSLRDTLTKEEQFLLESEFSEGIIQDLKDFDLLEKEIIDLLQQTEES